MNETATHLQNALVACLSGHEFSAFLDEVRAPEDLAVVSAVTFADAGVLTRDAGLVIRLEDGQEFQIALVRSR